MANIRYIICASMYLVGTECKNIKSHPTVESSSLSPRMALTLKFVDTKLLLLRQRCYLLRVVNINCLRATVPSAVHIGNKYGFSTTRH